MKKLLVFTLSFISFINFSGCSGEEEPSVNVEASAEITVKNGSGGNQQNIYVYVFEQPSTEPDGSNPDHAIESQLTDENGIAEFDLNNISITGTEKTVYFTVLEELLNGDYNVIGSVAGTILKEESTSVRKDITLSNQLLGYPNGYLPSTISSSLASSEYNRYKSSQMRPCNDGYRMIADPSSETRVEAIGFGMLLSAYAEDKDTFDGLLNFYKAKKSATANNMMAWLVTCDGVEDPGSATDGDIDVAFSLIVASQHWGDSYLNEAKEIIEILSSSVLTTCTVDGQTVNVLYPGYSINPWGGCEMTDIQYYTPAFFRVFADVSGDVIWDELADDSYIILNASAHPDTGLVPDWQTADGDPGPGGRAGHFGYDACRVPWRMALDYLWNGNSEAKAWCTKVASWANGVGPTNLVDGYELDGEAIGTNGLNSAFLGGFSVSAMTSSPALSNKFAEEMNKLNDNYWFNFNTRVLYLFTMTGNFQKPTL